MYRKTFKLKQHTPIIHFQHDQTGATLRATEVKPKLDRYVLEKLGQKYLQPEEEMSAFEKGKILAKERNWLVSTNSEHALNYKFKISPIGLKELYLPLSLGEKNEKQLVLTKALGTYAPDGFTYLAPSPYFANEDKYKIRGRPPVLVGAESKLDELRFGVFHRSGIDGEITSLNKSLLLFISQSLELFFIWESFGTRQSKGFGSFTIDLIGEKRVVPSKQALSKLFVRSKSVKPDVVQIMSQIKEEFALLKSGINFKGYKKSELFMYFVKQGVRWEKRHIKQAIDSGHNGEKAKRELYSKKNIPPINWNDGSDKFENYWTDPEGANYNYQFIRALLGLTDKYEFQVFKKRRDGQNWQVEYDDRDAPKVDYGSGFNVNIKHLPAEKEPTIDRFKSPIRYKVIENKIYVGADHSYRSILGKVFQFTYDFNDRNGEPKVTRLTTPTKFNIIDFLNKHLSKDWKSI